MNRILFYTEAYKYLARGIQRLCKDWDLGQVERQIFPDRETYHRILTPVYGAEVAIVGGTHTDADFLEIVELALTLRQLGVHRLKLIIPYYGYSTMERAVKQGEVVKARTRALLLSALPAGGSLEVILLDLHADGITHYFQPHVRATHVYAKPLLLEAMLKAVGSTDFILGSTDAGRAKWVESLARDLGVQPAFVYKERSNGSDTRITGINADVAGRTVVLYDDMIRTGGTLMKAAEAYRKHGATRVMAFATHLVMPGVAELAIHRSGLFDKLCGTDSHPRSQELAIYASGWLRILPTAPLFAPYLNQSLS
jgi:ribose-phosphate pyrophosphokinase